MAREYRCDKCKKLIDTDADEDQYRNIFLDANNSGNPRFLCLKCLDAVEAFIDEDLSCVGTWTDERLEELRQETRAKIAEVDKAISVLRERVITIMGIVR